MRIFHKNIQDGPLLIRPGSDRFNPLTPNRLSDSPPMSAPPSDEVESFVPRRSWWAAYWEKAGGGSLTISLILHGAVLVLAVFWFIHTQVSAPPEKTEFLPGGGGGQGGKSVWTPSASSAPISNCLPRAW